jgi:hypothetical protein
VCKTNWYTAYPMGATVVSVDSNNAVTTSAGQVPQGAMYLTPVRVGVCDPDNVAMKMTNILCSAVCTQV